MGGGGGGDHDAGSTLWRLSAIGDGRWHRISAHTYNKLNAIKHKKQSLWSSSPSYSLNQQKKPFFPLKDYTTYEHTERKSASASKIPP